jgi:NAD(P)-dependent dehydrogenase (short-subunit alcohol dehydrogenase family)
VVIDFNGQVVIVTGAGRGLGRQYALDVARRGAKVLANDLGCSVDGHGSDPSVADQVVEEIRAAGGTAEASHDTVGTPEGGAAIVQSALDHFGRVDAVVANAGIVEFIPFEDIPVENWRRMVNTHLDGAFYVSQPAYRVMKAQGYGRFVFIASAAGAFGMPQGTHYGAAKAGIVGLTNNIALEGAPHGILANAVLPFGLTRMAGDAQEGSLLALSTAERVVPIVVFLASRACSVSHQNYSACAGRYARVFIGAADGWFSGDGVTATADDILEHLDDVTATDPFSIPGSLVEEMEAVARRIGLGASLA